MRVVGWRRSLIEVEGVTKMYVGKEEFHAFLAECDFVVIVLPLTDATRGLFDEAAFAAMRDGAVCDQRRPRAHRGGTGAHPRLESGKVAGATLDVFDVEPLPAITRFGAWTTSSSRRTCPVRPSPRK